MQFLAQILHKRIEPSRRGRRAIVSWKLEAIEGMLPQLIHLFARDFSNPKIVRIMNRLAMMQRAAGMKKTSGCCAGAAGSAADPWRRGRGGGRGCCDEKKAREGIPLRSKKNKNQKRGHRSHSNCHHGSGHCRAYPRPPRK